MRFAEPARTFGIGSSAFLLDDQPFVIRCGEVQAACVPSEEWRHRSLTPSEPAPMARHRLDSSLRGIFQ